MKFTLFYLALVTVLFVRVVVLDISARAHGLLPPEVSLGIGPKITTLSVGGRTYDVPILVLPTSAVDPFQGRRLSASSDKTFVEQMKHEKLERPAAWIGTVGALIFVMIGLAVAALYLRFRIIGSRLLENPLAVEAVSPAISEKTDLKEGDILLSAKGDSGEVVRFPEISYLPDVFSLGFAPQTELVLLVRRAGDSDKLREIWFPAIEALWHVRFRSRLSLTTGLETWKRILGELHNPAKQFISIFFPIVCFHDGIRKQLTQHRIVLTSRSEVYCHMVAYYSIFVALGSLIPFGRTGGLELWLACSGLFHTVTYYDYMVLLFGIIYLIPFFILANLVTWIGLARIVRR